ncbi:MAG: carbohydrate ABC transporter permease [Anaerolineae bacterium]|nr:carbohydrate ABC transporter permease [Anaerolineae bacterium]
MITSRLTRNFDRITTHLLLGLFAVIAVFPIAYTFATSFKDQNGVLTKPPTFFPSSADLTASLSLEPGMSAADFLARGLQDFPNNLSLLLPEAYRVVINSDMTRHYLPNSIINSTLSSILVVILASLASYTFSRYRFRGSRALELAILGLMMIPGLTNLIPLRRIGAELGILSTHELMVLVYTAGGLPFAIWIVKSFFDAIPIELEEAALIDGCTPLQALRYVVIPLAMPGMLAAFLLMFVDTWNEFLAALVLLSGTARTVTVGLYDFQSSFEIAYHVWTAACIMIMLPVLILFVALRRQFFQAMLQGALKG